MSNTSKTSKSLVLMAALLALLSSPAPGMAAGPAPVDLGSAGNFVILSESGISDVSPSAIVGDIGTSPIAGTAITATSGNICKEVVGTIYTANNAGPACRVFDATLLGLAVGDMMTAYNDAAGRTLPDFINLGAGNITGMTLAPGLYNYTTDLSINAAGVTLSGGANDVWIFQIAGNLTVSPGAIVTLSGGAQAKNIFWQVAGGTLLDTTADFKGIILCKTLIALNTGATLEGRALAQTAVTLQKNIIGMIDTIDTKTECTAFLKAAATVFNAGQKAALQAFTVAQAADKLAFTVGQKADLLVFTTAQAAAKQVFLATLPPPTAAQQKTFNDLQHSALQAFQAGQKTALKVFQAGQNTAKQTFAAGQNTAKLAFQAEQKIDMQECNTLP